MGNAKEALYARIRKAPARIGFTPAFVCMGVFLAVAATPYLKAGYTRIAAGESINMSALARDVKQSEKGFEPRAVAARPDGSLLIGGKYGLVHLQAETFTSINYPGRDIRALLEHGDVLHVAAKDGIWRRNSQGEWENVLPGDFFSIYLGDEAYYATGKRGVFECGDDGRWKMLEIDFSRAPVVLNSDDQEM